MENTLWVKPLTLSRHGVRLEPLTLGHASGLAAAAAGAGDQSDIEHGGDSWRMIARRLPAALERGKWQGDRDLVG